jgi:4-amino-4-deoxy-L-arabinose transferase-like glycosyltransferase
VKNARLLAAFCLVGLVAAWAIDLFYFPDHPVLPDESRFLGAAEHLRATGEFLTDGRHAREMPLTAAVFAVLGPNLLLIRLVQALAIPLQAWLVAAIGRRLFGPRVGLMAGCVSALYPYFLFFQGTALSETFFTVAQLAFVAALYRIEGLPRRAAFASGLGALATYFKASLTILPPFLILPFAKPRTALVGFAVYLLCLAPWWIRNYELLHAFVPFSTTASMNLFIGNNPHATTGRGDWAVDADPAEVDRLEAIPGEVARSRAYTKAAEDFIESNPGRFVDLCLLRLREFWSPIPNAASYRATAFTLLAGLTSGPMLIFAAIGLVVTWRRWRRLIPLYVLIGYFTALHTITIASLRYRLPIEPLLILFAAAGVSSCYDWLARARSRTFINRSG